MEICKSVDPPLQEHSAGRRVACHLFDDSSGVDRATTKGVPAIAEA